MKKILLGLILLWSQVTFAQFTEGWYRIGQSNQTEADALMELTADGQTLSLSVGVTNTSQNTQKRSIYLSGVREYASSVFSKVRFVQKSVSDPIYLDVYVDAAFTSGGVTTYIGNAPHAIEAIQFQAATIPTDYTATEIELDALEFLSPFFTPFAKTQSGGADGVITGGSGTAGVLTLQRSNGLADISLTYQDMDTQLSEAEVDGYVANNNYLQTGGDATLNKLVVTTAPVNPTDVARKADVDAAVNLSLSDVMGNGNSANGGRIRNVGNGLFGNDAVNLMQLQNAEQAAKNYADNAVAGDPFVLNRTPTDSTDTVGSPWDIAADENYLYIKTENGGWKRVALSSF